MGVLNILRKLRQAYCEGKNCAGIMGAYFPPKVWTEIHIPEETGLISLLIGVECFLQQREIKRSYNLMQRIAYRFGFDFASRFEE